MEKSKTKQKNKLLPILAVALVALVVGVALLVTQCIGGGNPASMSSGELAQALAKEGDATIRLDGDVVLEGTVTVNGNKTLTGNGTIILGTALGDQWPEEEKPSWGMGCSKLEAQQASAMASATASKAGMPSCICAWAIWGGCTVIISAPARRAFCAASRNSGRPMTPLS